MEDMFHPVRPKRLSDNAIEQIVTLVRDGKLPAGAKLPAERQLMNMLSVSRTSLREAIRTLETMGVLRVVPGRGTYVREDGVSSYAEDWYAWLMGHRLEVVQILEMHEALEVKVAELAATRVTPEQVAALEQELEVMRRAAVDEDEHEALVRADAAFHRIVREASGNEVIARLLGDLEGSVDSARHALMSLPSRVQRVIPDHEAILAGIRAGDAEIASACTLAHIRRSKEELIASGTFDWQRSDDPEVSVTA
jgi:GntR family transcriptional repressor for pyruvate dehydrogenase complex